MPANKYALIRYRVIDRCLNNPGKPYPTREDLRDACEEALFGSGAARISLSTIDKDIHAMKNESELGYFAPIRYNREKGGYEYTETGYSINQVSLGEEDMEALRFAAVLLHQFREVPVLKHYQNAVEKIRSKLTLDGHADTSPLDRYIQFERSTVSGGHQWLELLLSCIRQQRECQLVYQTFRDDAPRAFLAHPLLLKEYANRWYLVAYVPGRGGELTFGLERILEARSLEGSFERPEGFDPDRFFRHSIGITESRGEPQHILLRCQPVAGKLLASQPVHETQRLVAATSESLTIALDVIPTRELRSLILSYGDEVTVLAPRSLARSIEEELERARANYTSGAS